MTEQSTAGDGNNAYEARSDSVTNCKNDAPNNDVKVSVEDVEMKEPEDMAKTIKEMYDYVKNFINKHPDEVNGPPRGRGIHRSRGGRLANNRQITYRSRGDVNDSGYNRNHYRTRGSGFNRNHYRTRGSGFNRYHSRGSGFNRNRPRASGYNRNRSRGSGYNRNRSRGSGYNWNRSRGSGYNRNRSSDNNEKKNIIIYN